MLTRDTINSMAASRNLPPGVMVVDEMLALLGARRHSTKLDGFRPQ